MKEFACFLEIKWIEHVCYSSFAMIIILLADERIKCEKKLRFMLIATKRTQHRNTFSTCCLQNISFSFLCLLLALLLLLHFIVVVVVFYSWLSHIFQHQKPTSFSSLLWLAWFFFALSRRWIAHKKSLIIK